MSNKVSPEQIKSANPSEDLGLDAKIEPKELEQIMSEIDTLQAKMQSMPDPGLDLSPEAILADSEEPDAEDDAPIGAAPAVAATSTATPSHTPTPTRAHVAVQHPTPSQTNRQMQGHAMSRAYVPSGQSAASVSMDLQGQITILLRHESGDEVVVHFTSEGIHLKMGDGIEFRIPARQDKLKKVA